MDDIKQKLWKIEEWTYTREVSALVINYVVSNEKAAVRKDKKGGTYEFRSCTIENREFSK